MALKENEQIAVKAFRSQLNRQLGSVIESVVLFGSKARGDDRPDSDIDLLVVCNTNNWRIANAVYSIATDVLLDHGIALSPKVLAKDDFARMAQEQVAFVANVEREGMTV